MEHNSKGKRTESVEISFRELIQQAAALWAYLLKRWVLIVAIAALGAIAGLCYSIFKKPLYIAELSFALEDEKAGGMGGLGSALGLASQLGVDLGGGSGSGAFTDDNLPQLMKMRSMVESTLLAPVTINGKKETLANVYLSFSGYRDSWSDEPRLSKVQFLPGADRSKFSLLQDSVLGIFYKDIIKKNLWVDKVDKKLSIITVKVTSKHELFSKYFAEILTKTVSDFYIDTKTRKSVHNVSILQHQTDSVRRELNSALTGVASSADVNPNANPALQILRVPSQRRQVDVQANQAILTQLVANLELSKVSLRKETPLVQVIDAPILPLEKERVGKAKGIVLGGLIAGFLTVLFLFVKKLFKDNMVEPL